MTTNILVVIDPTADQHAAHLSLIDLTCRKQLDSDFTLLLCIDPKGVNTNAENESVFVDASLIAKLEAPYKELGSGVQTLISWSHEWPESILNTAEKMDADFVAVSHPGKDKPELADDYWKLIRSTTKPLIIVNPMRPKTKPVVLVAVDLQDDTISDRNTRVLEAAKGSSNLWDAELHLVNAYSDSSHYPDRGRLVSLTGLANENIHIEQGEPDKVLGKLTEELNPMLVVLGATRRNTGIKAALRGAKVARIFNNIEHDLIIVT